MNYYDFKISNVIIDILALSVNIAISNFKKIYHAGTFIHLHIFEIRNTQ
jgi:hypothetical protein